MWSASRQRSWIAARFDGLFVYLCIIICSAWLLALCFSRTLVFPTPVAAASVQDTSMDLCPGLNSPAGRENAAQPLCLGGESQQEKGAPAGPIPGIQQLMHRRFSTLAGAQGLRTVSVPPREWRGAGMDQACVYSQPWINLSSSMFLLIPAGSHAAVVQ